MKIEEAARGLGIDAIGLDRDVSALSGGQRTKVLLAKAYYLNSQKCYCLMNLLTI